jgi:D-inositol-3-phosphate glycosyltransferase
MPMQSLRALLRTYRANSSAATATGRVQRGDDERPLVQSSSTHFTRLALLWTSLGATKPTDAFRASGKYVAAAEWTRAVASYGGLPVIDLFTPITAIGDDPAMSNASKSHQDDADDWQPTTARWFPESDLSVRFATEKYNAFHNPFGIDFARMAYFRSNCSKYCFPITGSQMGISYSPELHPCWIGLLTAEILPCDAIVCSSQASRSAMEKRLADIAERYCRAWNGPIPTLPRLELIPWAVDTQRFAPRDPLAARRDLDLPLDRPIVLCLGRVAVQDKMDLVPVLLALERVSHESKQQPYFLIAGNNSSGYGEYLTAIARQLGFRENIRFLFDLPAACLPALYAACDIFASPVDTPSESFGLTILEAMACGRPVIGSDWNGYRDLIVHGETGFRIRTDWADCLREVNELAPCLWWEQEHLHVGQSVNVDVTQMVDYLRQLLENQHLREQMGLRGRARVEALYSWPSVIRRWIELYEELAAIAESLVPGEPDRAHYLQPNYFVHFSHYASRIIDESVPICITPRGEAVLAGKSRLLLHPWATGFLQAENLYVLLLSLKSAKWIRIAVPIGELLRVVDKRNGLSRDQALLHLMWLAKYDLVLLGNDPNLPLDGSQV